MFPLIAAGERVHKANRRSFTAHRAGIRRPSRGSTDFVAFCTPPAWRTLSLFPQPDLTEARDRMESEKAVTGGCDGFPHS
jgi:hypothetical protein